MKRNLLPTQEYLKECLEYNRETGFLYWKERPLHHFKNRRSKLSCNTRMAGKIAFNVNHSGGYKSGKLDGVWYLAHRVVYKLISGNDPEIVDHGKGGITDNRFENLTDGTHRNNSQHLVRAKNNTSGVTGVYWYKQTQRWQVRIGIGNSKNKTVGYFKNFEDAVSARKRVEIEYGYHEDHGKERNA